MRPWIVVLVALEFDSSQEWQQSTFIAFKGWTEKLRSIGQT
jgi:hypothetical protein